MYHSCRYNYGTFFRIIQHQDESRLYDSFFANSASGFNQKLHREDRQHAKLTGLDIYTEVCRIRSRLLYIILIRHEYLRVFTSLVRRIWQETQKRVVSASGSNYGHWNHWARPPSERGPVRYVFDSPDRTFAMRNNIEAEFYRRNKPFTSVKNAELH